MDEFVKIVNSGNASDVGRVGRVIRYLDWGGFVLELDDGNVVTLALGDVEIDRKGKYDD